jgi:thiamine biosynthesis lipoprotein
MKKTQIIMGMPITIEIIGKVPLKLFNEVFDYFRAVDRRYSTYKKDSEISQINSGLPKRKWSREMKMVISLCEDTKKASKGYFDISHNGKLDPSGLVKGWSVLNASKLLLPKVKNFYIEAGGDIEVHGHNDQGERWRIGIRNPFNINEIIKTVALPRGGMATSGTYIRGEHIYNPINPSELPGGIKSITIIGPNVYEADRFATASFAMGVQGINFIEKLPGLEGYMVDDNGIATFTSGFERYVVQSV